MRQKVSDIRSVLFLISALALVSCSGHRPSESDDPASLESTSGESDSAVPTDDAPATTADLPAELANPTAEATNDTSLDAAEPALITDQSPAFNEPAPEAVLATSQSAASEVSAPEAVPASDPTAEPAPAPKRKKRVHAEKPHPKTAAPRVARAKPAAEEDPYAIPDESANPEFAQQPNNPPAPAAASEPTVYNTPIPPAPTTPPMENRPPPQPAQTVAESAPFDWKPYVPYLAAGAAAALAGFWLFRKRRG